MKLSNVIAAISVALFATVALADDDHGRHEDHGRPAEDHRPTREPAPKWEAHKPGVHPNGATYKSHPVRVLKPEVIVHGRAKWNHWAHPDFVRPVYYWDWGRIHQVTCVAEDSYGDQYPVTEATGRGFGLETMTNVEDDALDRCYNESGEDNTCYLATCSHV
jgi:hypothetical protein